MTWIRRLRTLPLRGKVAVTFVAVVALALTVSTVLSFRYWQKEFLAASEQQVSLAAASTRAALESTVPGGHLSAGRRSLTRLVEGAPVSAARVYGAGGAVLLSADRSEEGRRPAVWIPSARELPRGGILHQTPSGDTVRAYVPVSLDAQGTGVLEIELPVASVKAAMERGALLGHGLMLVSFVALGLIVVTMLEREVVTPLHRLEDELVARGGPPSARRDEVGRLQYSVTRLLERQREAQNLADRKDRELAVRQGLADVGEMAAEMAHEFKRPLASIRTAVEVLQQEYSLDEGGREVLGRMDHQLERLSETMRDLFSLARPVAVAVQPVALEEVVDDALMELRALPGAERVRIERDLEPDLPPAPGDRHRLEQAVFNVMTNAFEAMPEGGTLRARAARVGPDRVEIAVEDTGPGLRPGEVERILRPFYSTKPMGTGLGLPLVARIVAAHGGDLQIDGVPGRGTTVRIVLPTMDSNTLSGGATWPASASSSSTTTT